MKTAIVIFLLAFSFIAHAQRMGGTPSTVTGPQLIIYKTKKNLDKYVPVTLSADGKSIVSYPAPGDIYINGKPAYPTILAKGYRLDNRGLNENSAFLNITYTAYRKMKQVDPIMLMKHIKSAHPFISMYKCGSRATHKHLVADLNRQINSGKLTECECIVKP